MNNNAMRLAVAEAYPGPGWKFRVSKMSDNQVLAVYRRLQETKKVP